MASLPLIASRPVELDPALWPVCAICDCTPVCCECDPDDYASAAYAVLLNKETRRGSA